MVEIHFIVQAANVVSRILGDRIRAGDMVKHCKSERVEKLAHISECYQHVCECCKLNDIVDGNQTINLYIDKSAVCFQQSPSSLLRRWPQVVNYYKHKFTVRLCCDTHACLVSPVFSLITSTWVNHFLSSSKVLRVDKIRI